MNDASLPINILAVRGIGDNSAAVPLSEILAEELAASRARADALLAAAKSARIEIPSDAGKVADLIALIRDTEREIDRAREGRRQPYAEQLRIVDAAFGALLGPLSRARTGPGSLTEMLDAWQREHSDAAVPASVASIGQRRAIEFVIEDFPAVLAWLLETHPGAIAQSVRTILGTVVRAFGVDAVERGDAVIPGVSITLARKTQVR